MKKKYNQPEVLVAHIRTMSLICGSDVESGAGKINPGTPTDEVW